MKTKNKFFKLLGIFLLVFSLTTFSSKIIAQGGGNVDEDYNSETGFNITEGSGSEGGNCGNGPHTHAGNAVCPNDRSNSVPLDGGLGILLLGAAAFGVKKLRQKK